MKLIRTAVIAAGLFALACGCDRPSAPPAATSAKPAPNSSLTNASKADSILRIHFVGTDQIAKATNADVLRKVLTLPSTIRLREEIRDRLEATQLKYPTPERTAAFRGMFDDLLNHESFYASRQSPGRDLEWALAVLVPGERAAAWRSALDPAKFSAPIISAMREGTIAVQSGDWLIVGRPGTNSIIWREVASRTKEAAGDSKLFFEIDANFALLTNIVTQPELADLPSVHLALSGKGEKVHTEGRLIFERPINWRQDNWIIPSFVPDEPLVSFTAAQGLSQGIGDQPAYKQMFPAGSPNQVFLWSRSDVPFQTFFDLPLPDATNQVRSVAATLKEFLARHAGLGELKLATNGMSFWIENAPVPMLGLFAGAGKDGDRNFLLGGFGNGLPPAGSKTNSPPAGLVAHVNGRTNLMYYDWEITSERLAQLRVVTETLWILAHQAPPSFVPAAAPWLESLNGLLGETTTEITVVSPRELKFERSSHAGLTGAELIALTKWIESPAFPGFKLPEFSAEPVMPATKSGK